MRKLEKCNIKFDQDIPSRNDSNLLESFALASILYIRKNLSAIKTSFLIWENTYEKPNESICLKIINFCNYALSI